MYDEVRKRNKIVAANLEELSRNLNVDKRHSTNKNVPAGSRVKRQVREADHSPSDSAEVKKRCIYISTPQYVCLA
jgi:hypothetical protein